MILAELNWAELSWEMSGSLTIKFYTKLFAVLIAALYILACYLFGLSYLIMYEHVPGVMWSCWHREVSITNKNSHTAIFALLWSVSSRIWSPGCEGVTLTTMAIWVTVKYARLDPPKPGQHLELFIFTENWPEDFTYLISEAICLKGHSAVSPQLVGIWKEEYLPLCDLISKIRETYQYVNIGENRERGTGELNSEDKMDILIL